MGRRHFPFPGGAGNPATNDLWWLHDLFFLLVAVAVVVGIVLVVRILARRPHQAPPMMGPPPWRSPALHELDMSYARGTLSREDYLQRRADLTGMPAPAPQPAAPPEEPPADTPAATTT